jgi:SnoaL-like domain
MSISESEIRDFFERFEAASNGKVWADLADLIHPDAVYRFTEGDFVGFDAIRGAFERTWSSPRMFRTSATTSPTWM